jgi:hypothetical protein
MRRTEEQRKRRWKETASEAKHEQTEADQNCIIEKKW